MGDDSRKSLVHALKDEWSLLWESLAGEDAANPENPFETGKLRSLTLDDVRRLTRELSQNRRKLNRRLETLQKEIELNTAKLDSIRSVGQDDENAVQKINDLSEQGQKISHELSQLNDRLRTAREQEDRLRRRFTLA